MVKPAGITPTTRNARFSSVTVRPRTEASPPKRRSQSA
jgi:hypothetical protein